MVAQPANGQNDNANTDYKVSQPVRQQMIRKSV